MKMKKIMCIILALAIAISLMTSAMVTVSADVDKTPLTFTGTENFIINLTKYGSASLSVPTLEYSFDNNSWNTYTPENQIEVNNASKTVYFRGSDNNAFSDGGSSYQWKITNAEGNEVTTGIVEASGNINTLLDYNNPPTEFTSNNNYCFYNMFGGCKALKKAPELPATKLADYCYDQMFRYCTSLTATPNLPATTLAKYCYTAMFGGCTAIKTAPELKATTLAEYCYNSMFSDCTSLKKAMAELPASTLEISCYNGMFSGCTALKTAPKLKATTLANTCYYNMFSMCSNIKISEVNSAELADWIMPSSTSAQNWSYRMLATGRFNNGTSIELGKMYRYERPTVPELSNSYDSGYYANTNNAQEKEGIIAFTSLFANISTFAFGTEDKFGMYIYKSGNEANKVELNATDFAELKDEDGYLYSFVTNISSDDFGKTVIAKPFVVIDDEVYYGDEIEATVNSNKWLGNVSNKPVQD